MSFKYFGAAVAIACLLTGFPLELAHGVYGLKEISDNGGSDPFGTVSPVLAPDPNEVAKVDGPDAPNTRSSPPAIVPVSGNYANILPVATSNNFSIPPVIDPLLLQTTFDKGNSNNLRPLANASEGQPYPTPTRSSRARTLRLHATLAPAGCARCVREAARASGSRANLFSALLSKNFFLQQPIGPAATSGRDSRTTEGCLAPDCLDGYGLDPGSPCRMTLGIVANVDCGHVRYQIVECLRLRLLATQRRH